MDNRGKKQQDTPGLNPIFDNSFGLVNNNYKTHTAIDCYESITCIMVIVNVLLKSEFCLSGK